MKKSPLTLITGLTLLLIFVLLLFTFQVRQTEVAIRTTFGKFSNTIEKPGLYFKLPWPIQRIHKFENRVQSFQCKLEQTTTREGRNLILTVFLGWKVSDARKFLERFDNGDRLKAESAIEGLVRDAKNSVFGRHPMGDLISPDPEKVRFQEIEASLLEVESAFLEILLVDQTAFMQVLGPPKGGLELLEAALGFLYGHLLLVVFDAS